MTLLAYSGFTLSSRKQNDSRILGVAQNSIDTIRNYEDSLIAKLEHQILKPVEKRTLCRKDMRNR